MKRYIGILFASLLPWVMQAQLVMTGDYYVVLTGGTQANPASLVLTNSAPAGITNTGAGWIVSENEFNQVDWNIGTNTGRYVVPFGYSNTDYLPVTCDITTAGTGGNGAIRFATYHGATWDNSNYEPSDVTNMTDFGAADYSKNAVDRFWILDAQGYTTKPTPDITFTYIRSGASSEIAAPNFIIEADLIAQRFNSSSQVWSDWLGTTGKDATAGNTGTDSSGIVPAAGFYRSWMLANDSDLLSGVQQISAISPGITTWPNPANQTINVKIGQGMDGDATISIVTMLGQELTRKRQYISSGMILPTDVSTLPAAMYFVRVSTNNFTATSKFIKQ